MKNKPNRNIEEPTSRQEDSVISNMLRAFLILKRVAGALTVSCSPTRFTVLILSDCEPTQMG